MLWSTTGLELTVSIGQNDYVKEAGDTAGLRLIVHPAERLPMPEDEGLTISPGHTTSIGLRKVATRDVFDVKWSLSVCHNPIFTKTA